MPVKEKFTKQVVELINKQIRAVRTVTSQGLFLRQFYPSGGGGAGEDEKVKVTVSDIVAEYLNDKIVGAAGIVTVILNPGAQEDLEISFAVENGNSFPGSPRDWQFFYRTDEDVLYIYDTSSWVPISGSGVWANVNLSNLINPTAINVDLLPGVDATINLGSNATPLRFANAFFGGLQNVNNIIQNIVNYVDNNYIGTLGLPATGIVGHLGIGGVSPGPWTAQDVAATSSRLYMYTSAGSVFNSLNLASRFSFVEVIEAGGTVNYNTPDYQAFHHIHYWRKDEGIWVRASDELWSGIRRDNYCGEGNVVAAAPDTWSSGVAYIYNLPDTNYACIAMGRTCVSVPTADPLVPLVDIYVDACGGQTGWKSISAVGAHVHYTVMDTASNLGIDAVGYPTAVFNAYTVLCALVPIIPPFNTLVGAGLDICDWIDRRYY